MRHSTGLLVVSFSRNCSVAVPDFELRFPLMTMFVNLHHFSILVGCMRVFIRFSSRVIMKISLLELSRKISRCCCQTTHGLDGTFFCWSPVCQSVFRSVNVAILVKMLGCSLDTTSHTAVRILFLRFVLPGKCPVCCIGSNIISLCGVVHFATCLTGREEKSRFSVNLVTVGVRVFCVTVFSSIILVAFNLLFLRHSVHLSFIRIFPTV